MGALALLAQLLTMSNTLDPLIAGLIADVKVQNPGMTDEEIIAKAEALAAETKQITEQDKGDQS